MLWQDSTWVKKKGNKGFDIPMECYDGAKICKLEGIYIENKFCKSMNEKDFGLFRDDRLEVFRNTSGPEEEDRKRENIIKILKECGPSITCKINKKIVDFLDVRFNLNDKIEELQKTKQ